MKALLARLVCAVKGHEPDPVNWVLTEEVQMPPWSDMATPPRAFSLRPCLRCPNVWTKVTL